MEEEKFPKNKKHFLKLKDFAKEILKICRDNEIKPIVYGSFLIFYYTKNENLKVNDIDFYIHERDFNNLIATLEENKIDYNYYNEWHTLKAKKGDLEIEFDSIEFWNKSNKKLQKIDFEGEFVEALDLDSLIQIYKQASETSEDNPEGNHKKYEMLINLKESSR